MSKVIDAVLIGGVYVADKVWDAFTSKTPSSPPAPYNQPAPTNVPTTIPTTKPKRGAPQTVKDDIITMGASLAMGGNQVNNTAITNYNNTINNITNNYNNAITNNNSMIGGISGASLLAALTCQCQATIASKGSIDALVASVATLNATTLYQATVLNNALASLTAAVSAISYTLSSLDTGSNVTVSPPSVNLTNNIDVSAIVSAVKALSVDLKALMPQSRLDYYDKSNQISDYKLTPISIDDVHGNDVIRISPLELQSKKDLAVATSHALENSTTLDDIDDSDIFDDDTLLQDAMKLFKFNGIEDNLVDIANSISNGLIDGYTPNVNLKV